MRLTDIMRAYVFSLLSIAFLFAATLAAKAQTPATDLKGKYRAIEVTRFAVDPSVDIPDNQIDVLMLEIVDELYKIKKFDQISKPSKTAPATKSYSQPTIRIEGTFTKYFALIPQKLSTEDGEIWTRVKVQVKFVDAADGKTLLEREVDRRIFFGALQFIRSDVTRKAAKEIAKITKKTFF